MVEPDFICIGAPKCGTNYLAAILRTHPNVFLPDGEFGASLNYFTDRYPNGKRGLEWYCSHFAGASDHQIAGEVSPSYFSDPSSASLIAKAFPKVKLLAILRDPAKRAISSFLHDKRQCRVPRNASFTEASRHNEKYLWDSMYHVHLERYFSAFGTARIHVTFLEELSADPQKETTAICEFLDISPPSASVATVKPQNEAFFPRSYALTKTLLGVRNACHRIGLGRVVRFLGHTRIGTAIWALNRRPPERVPESVYSEIRKGFEEENFALARLLRRDDLCWK